MLKILAKIDALIGKIPIHIRDLIQKGFISIVALLALLAIVAGIKKGIDNAKPGGVQLFGKNKDIFYIQRLREDNAKRNRLIEDIEVYEDLFESRDERLHPTFQRLGKDTDDRIIGEREEFIKKDDPLRKKDTDLMIEDRENRTEDYAAPDNLKIEPKENDTPLLENQGSKQKAKNLTADESENTSKSTGESKHKIKIESDAVKLIE